VQAELLGVEQGDVLADQAAGLHGLHPRQAGRGREVHAARQLHIGEAGIALKLVQYLYIDEIQHIYLQKITFDKFYADKHRKIRSSQHHLRRHPTYSRGH